MTDTSSLGLSQAARHVAQQEADKLLAEAVGIRAVVVATVDGFDVASAVLSDLEPSRLAAMASSISAIAYVVSDEASLGQGKRVTIETDAGFALVSSVARVDAQLIVIVITDGRTLLGQLAYRTTAMTNALLNAP